MITGVAPRVCRHGPVIALMKYVLDMCRWNTDLLVFICISEEDLILALENGTVSPFAMRTRVYLQRESSACCVSTFSHGHHVWYAGVTLLHM